MKTVGTGLSRPSTPEMAALFEALYPRVRRIALAMTGDAHQADDLAQESFVRAWKTLSRPDVDDAALAAYLRTTVINLVRRSFRRRMTELRAASAFRPANHDQPTETRLDILSALRTLPPRQRACVVLRYLEDLSEAETAETLGVSTGTVKSQTHKALARLGDVLGGTDATY